MKTKQFILMGDIVTSSTYSSSELQDHFRTLVNFCNAQQSSGILSPYTITLGDEFQGVSKDLKSAVEAIFFFDKMLLKGELNFKMRYVVHYGEIDTPINQEIAYGMLGAGLTKARKMLSSKRRDRPKYQFDLEHQLLSQYLNQLFSVLDGLTQDWSPKDYNLIFDMLQESNNQQVATKYEKDRSQIWKRRKNLYIKEYQTIQTLIFDLIKNI